MQYELLDILKAFVYNVQNKINDQDTENFVDINNPAIIKHKGRPPKRLKNNVETSLSKGKQALKNSTQVNITDENTAIEGTKNRKCGKCRQYGHYAKTCPNN